MKLVFKKNKNGDVSVTMFKGTAEAQFSYIEMIKALLASEALDSDYDESISMEEQTQINDVLKEIENTAIFNLTKRRAMRTYRFEVIYKDDCIEGMQLF